MAWGAVPICCTALCRLLARNGRSMCADKCLFLVEKRSCSGHHFKDRVCPTTDLAPAERLQNARRNKLIVGYKSWILPAMNGCSPNQQPRKGTAHEALLCPRRLLHGPAHRGSRSRTHLRSRAG